MDTQIFCLLSNELNLMNDQRGRLESKVPTLGTIVKLVLIRRQASK